MPLTFQGQQIKVVYQKLKKMNQHVFVHLKQKCFGYQQKCKKTTNKKKTTFLTKTKSLR